MVHMVSVKAFMSPGFGGEYDRLRVLCMRSSRSFLTVRGKKGGHRFEPPRPAWRHYFKICTLHAELLQPVASASVSSCLLTCLSFCPEILMSHSGSG